MIGMESIKEALEQTSAVILFLAAMFLFATFFTKTQAMEDVLNMNINNKTQISKSLVGNSLQNSSAEDIFELILSTSAEKVYIEANEVSTLLAEIRSGSSASMVRLKSYLNPDKTYIVKKEYDDKWQLKTIMVREGDV